MPFRKVSTRKEVQKASSRIWTWAVDFVSYIAQSAGAVEYTDCTSAEG